MNLILKLPLKQHSSSSDKKTFNVKFESECDELPKIFPSTTRSTEISCSASTDKKTLTCSPTSSTMKSDESYKIAYQKSCDGDKVDTGITVKYSASMLIQYSQLLLVIGLLLF